MYLNDSVKEKCLKLQEMSKIDLGIICGEELSTTLCDSKGCETYADIILRFKEDNSLEIFIVADSKEMFKKYKGLKGQELFENKMRDALLNTKAEDCISYSQIWYSDPEPKYEMSITEIEVFSYIEVLDLLNIIASTLFKFYTIRKILD